MQGLKRPIQPANAQGLSTLINRGHRAAIQGVMTLVELLSGRDVLGASLSAGYMGDAFRLTANSGTNTATLKRGLAWLRDSSGDDDPAWSGEVRPIYAEADLTLAFGTNGAGSARIDAVFIRPLITDSDTTALNVKDAVGGPVRVESHQLTRTYGFETQVLQGTPGGAAPATPSGWLRVADVTRAPSVASVAQADIVDRRFAAVAEGVLEASALSAARRLWLGLHKTATDYAFQAFVAQEAEGDHEAGDLVIANRDYDDVTPTGRVRVGELVAHTRGVVAELRKLGAGALSLLNSGGTGFEYLRARNTLIAACVYDTASGIITGSNVLSVTFPGSNVVRVTFEADKEWGETNRVIVLGGGSKIADDSPLIPVVLGSTAAHVNFYLTDLTGAKITTGFRLNIAIVNVNPNV